MSILYTAPEVAPRGADLCLLLDADYLAYMVGNISQADTKSTDIRDQEYTCVSENPDIWKWVDPVPLVEWRVNNEIEKLKDRLNTDNIEVWLTPDTGNFRYEVAVTRPYKSGRSTPRPYHFETVRECLRSVHQAKTAVDCEADDMVATRQMDHFRTGEKSIIVSNDKDLKCMFGWNYNPRTDEQSWITWEMAALNFYGQMITGDTVDSIPGCKGRGPKYWEKIKADLLHHYNCMPLDSRESLSWIDEVHHTVWDTYLTKGHDIHYFTEQGQLLHMRRNLDEMWDANYDWSDGYVAEY